MGYFQRADDHIFEKTLKIELSPIPQVYTLNMNFISKFKINAFEINAGKGTRHFNPLEDYRFFHHWFSEVKMP
jgi:hypothetical protein